MTVCGKCGGVAVTTSVIRAVGVIECSTCKGTGATP